MVLKVNKFGQNVAIGMPLQFHVQMRTSSCVVRGTRSGKPYLNVLVVTSTLYVTSSNSCTTLPVTLAFAPTRPGGRT